MFYQNYFKIPISNQDKSWVPHVACKSCVETLRRWNNAKSTITPMPFKTPMFWREPFSHNDCYFCLTKTVGFNSKNSHNIKYPNIASVMKPAPFESDDIPPTPPNLKQKTDDDIGCDNRDLQESEDIDSLDYDDSNFLPVLFDQAALNDMVRNLGLPKNKSELLGSRLKKRIFLAPGKPSLGIDIERSHLLSSSLKVITMLIAMMSVRKCKNIDCYITLPIGVVY